MGLTHKFIVELDLVGYSRIGGLLEQQIDAGLINELNEQILGFIRSGVAATGKSWADVVYLMTGDGAILGFDAAEQVYLFAKAVNDATREHNKNRDEHAKRYFRIGAAYGEVALERKGSEWKLAGMTVARAVRLEAAASSGCMMIDHATFNEMPARIAAAFSRPRLVRGKRDEMFTAHLFRFLTIDETGEEEEEANKREAESPAELSKAKHACDEDLATVRRNNIEMMRQLHSGELIDLVYLLLIPEQEQPSPKDTPADRARSIREWAARSNKDRDLCMELHYLFQHRE